MHQVGRGLRPDRVGMGRIGGIAVGIEQPEIGRIDRRREIDQPAQILRPFRCSGLGRKTGFGMAVGDMDHHRRAFCHDAAIGQLQSWHFRARIDGAVPVWGGPIGIFRHVHNLVGDTENGEKGFHGNGASSGPGIEFVR